MELYRCMALIGISNISNSNTALMAYVGSKVKVLVLQFSLFK